MKHESPTTQTGNIQTEHLFQRAHYSCYPDTDLKTYRHVIVQNKSHELHYVPW